MDVQVTAGCLVHAIAADAVSQAVRQATDEFQKMATQLLTDFAASDPTPQETLNLENALGDQLRQLGQRGFSGCFPSSNRTPSRCPGLSSIKARPTDAWRRKRSDRTW